ncbi:hypothetical protein ABHF33_10980 [Chitinibacter sp. FCG-7]|uniref:Uncharacterized protein n=1 Tax=Chitinibacter mangrovi TaxID=3153927 RepID=A0AAU7F7L2_9NEIS
MPKPIRTLLGYIAVIIATLAFERNAPLSVVVLAGLVLVLSQVIGGRSHA